MATDAELNEVIGLKKLAPYRTMPDKKTATRKKKLKELRDKLKTRQWGEAVSNSNSTTYQRYTKQSALQHGDDEQPRAKKRKGKKERQKAKATIDIDAVET